MNRHPASRWGQLGLALAGLVLAGAAGCARRTPARDEWGTFVAERHRQADQRLDEGDVEAARVALLSVLQLQARRPARDHQLALQDTYFRLARLSLDQHQPRQALEFADQGLAQGTAPHLFVANLLVARAAAEEALAEPQAAVNDYHRALLMNEALLAQVVKRP